MTPLNKSLMPTEASVSKSKLMPLYLLSALVLIALVCPFYFIFIDSEAAYWITRAQGEIMDGNHFMMLTFLLTALIFFLPAAFLVRLLGSYYHTKKKTD